MEIKPGDTVTILDDVRQYDVTDTADGMARFLGAYAVETVVTASADGSYTEAYLLDDGSIGLHVEDGAYAAEPRYTLEQAAALHRALGHLLYLAQDAD